MESSTEEDDAFYSKKNNNNGDCDGENRRTCSGDGIADLDDSELTVDSVINEPGSGNTWFGGIGTDFLHCLTDNVSPVVSGVATLVHKTAVAVANEISQLERDGELKAEVAAAEQSDEDFGGREKGMTNCNAIYSSASFDRSNKKLSESLILPWEICQESSQDPSVTADDAEIPVYFTDKELMKKIFALSTRESTFLQPFSDNSPDSYELQKSSISSFCSTFVMDEPRVKLIRRIMDIDKNLASVHSRLTGEVTKSSEIYFWKNYFFQCERIRADEFLRRKKQNETTKTAIEPSSETANSFSCSPAKQNNDMQHTNSNDDDESLVPVGSDIEDEQDDDSSYVIQSAPNTGETFTTSRSIDDDIVLVDTHERTIGGIGLDKCNEM